MKNIRIFAGKSMQFGWGGRVITLRIGVAAVRQEDTYDDLYKRADAALYLAKKRGRNQYMLSEEK